MELYSYISARLLWLKHHYPEVNDMLEHPVFDKLPAVKALGEKLDPKPKKEHLRACIMELARLCERQQQKIDALEAALTNVVKQQEQDEKKLKVVESMSGISHPCPR